MTISSKKTALYAFLLVAAGLGLAIDRLYAPAEVKEAIAPLRLAFQEISAMGSDIPPDTGPPIAALFDPIHKGSLATEDTKGLDRPATTRDAFSLSSEMRNVYQRQKELAHKIEEMARKKQEEEARDIIAGFASAHKLQCIFLHATDKWIVVDGRFMRIGDTLGEFSLCEIERYRALFKTGSHLVALQLPAAVNTKVTASEQR